jgi:hypothetical protein
MRIKNITPKLYIRHFAAITIRDMGILAYCLFIEHSSLEAFTLLARDFKKTLDKRKLVQARRRADDAYLARWFRFKPVSEPFEALTPASESAARVGRKV